MPDPDQTPPRVDFPCMLRFLTAGESHGRALVVIVEGLPAGLLVTAEDIQAAWPEGGSVSAGARGCASRPTR